VFGTQYGFHNIQLVKTYHARIASFDEVKDQIVAKLREDYVEDEYMRWRREVADPDKAKVNKEKLEEFIRTLLKK
jgi:parvulin-like peptidyl-prolyl isomerase